MFQYPSPQDEDPMITFLKGKMREFKLQDEQRLAMDSESVARSGPTPQSSQYRDPANANLHANTAYGYISPSFNPDLQYDAGKRYMNLFETVKKGTRNIDQAFMAGYSSYLNPNRKTSDQGTLINFAKQVGKAARYVHGMRKNDPQWYNPEELIWEGLDWDNTKSDNFSGLESNDMRYQHYYDKKRYLREK